MVKPLLTDRLRVLCGTAESFRFYIRSTGHVLRYIQTSRVPLPASRACNDTCAASTVGGGASRAAGANAKPTSIHANLIDLPGSYTCGYNLN